GVCSGGKLGPCGVVGNCHPGQLDFACADSPRACVLEGDAWNFASCPSSGNASTGVGTPLVLAFHAERVTFTRAEGAFDVFGEGRTLESAWVGAATPWLAIDHDGNGSIDDGRELFGSMTILPAGMRASNGFVALAALDDDGDGWITEKDASFAK